MFTSVSQTEPIHLPPVGVLRQRGNNKMGQSIPYQSSTALKLVE